MQPQSTRRQLRDEDDILPSRGRLNSLAIVGYVLIGLGLLIAFCCLVAIDTKTTQFIDGRTVKIDDLSLAANKLGIIILSVGVAIIGAFWTATGIRKPLGERE